MLFPLDLLALPTDDVRFPTNDHDHPLTDAFRQFVEDPKFPCVGAKAALRKGRLSTIVVDDIGSDVDDGRIHAALLAFVSRYRIDPLLFQSFVVIFEGGRGYSEESFERHLWSRVQALCDHDADIGHGWDARVAADVDDPHFSLSVAGEAFFVVGLHPDASRPARRFCAPVLVFNLHDQFDRLRREGRYERLRDAILERDEALTGSANPMLARHGETSEARQYSGRIVGNEWRCPFQPPRATRTN